MSKQQKPSYGPLAGFFHLFPALVWLFAACLAAPAMAGDRLIVAFGDSLTAGYQLPPDAAFPARLEAALRKEGYDVGVRNAGVSGDTSAQGRARLNWVLNALPRRPDLVILALGANDMLRGQPVARTAENLDAILVELHKRGIPVILAGMLAAPNMGPRYGAAYNGLFPALARKHGTALYPFFLDGVAANPALQLPDGMHPNQKGVERMVRGILPIVRQSLDQMK